jgi:alpha/beta superfamily hydrolase
MSRLILSGPAGRIEALLDAPPESPRVLAVLCHPHPLGGGTIHTHALYWAARVLVARGWAVLRFNFRGVGLSAGVHDEGRGERLDARVALEELRGRWPGLPIVMGGFSFGAWVGLSAGIERDVEGLLGIGLPYPLYDFSFLEHSRRPKALVHAERDEYATLEVVETAVKRMQPPARLWVIRGGATHLFTENLEDYRKSCRAAGEWLEEEIGVVGLPQDR